MDAEEIADVLLEADVVRVNTARPFKYSSGILSPIYTNCRLISYSPRERKIIVDAAVEKINEDVDKNDIDIIVGAGPPGTPFATYLSKRLKIPMAYTRLAAKEHGKGKPIEGFFRSGDRALLVGDIMSTEENIPISVRAIESEGGDVSYCLAIFNNNLNMVDQFLKDAGIPYSCLSDLKTLLTVAKIKKRISHEDVGVISQWMASPEEWALQRQNKLKKLIEEDKEKIAETLLNIKAITLSPQKPYTFTSGILSPIYADNRLLISYIKEWDGVISSFVNLVVNDIGIQNVSAVAGTETAATPHAANLADELDLPLISIRKEKKRDTTEYVVEGEVKKDDKVIVLEDLISTGGSSLGTISALREKGAVVEHLLVIFNYEMEKAKSSFLDSKVEVHSLTNIFSLLDVATRLGKIKDSEKEVVVDWTKDTKGWGRKMGFE